MVLITDIYASEILDSRGWPTVEAKIRLSDGTEEKASVPAGASIGGHEAFELRDNDPNRFQGKGVLVAIDNIQAKIKPILLKQDAFNQRKIDQLMLELDGTVDKHNLGANSILAVSAVVCKAAAKSANKELFVYFGELYGQKNFFLPQPLILVIEGGKHGSWPTDIQEYFLILKNEKFPSFSEKFQLGNLIFKTIGEILKEAGYGDSIGYEGAFSPPKMESNSEALEIILEAIKRNNKEKEIDFVLGIDVAANSFFENGKYQLKTDNLVLDNQEWFNYLLNFCQKYPVRLIEDPFFEDDWESWKKITGALANKCQIVGDDLLTTNVSRIKTAIEKKAVNSVIIKPNQIGTVTETLEAISLCQKNSLTPIISHRGGETNDDLIADLGVGTGCPQAKFGGFRQNERLVKYLRLLDIEENLLKKNI